MSAEEERFDDEERVLLRMGAGEWGVCIGNDDVECEWWGGDWYEDW